MIEAAAKSAVAPDSVTDDIFRSVGVCAWRDLGGALFLLFEISIARKRRA